MIREQLTRRADELASARTPFAVATVVRRQRPSSVRPGDAALVLADGTIDGFVGGACAEESVRLHGLRVLETGEPLLLRIVPGDGDAPAQEGAVTVSNPCLSGGALEIFLEPHLPAPRVVVIGDTPIALAVGRLAREVGFDPAVSSGEGDQPVIRDDDAAVVVASHGHGEEEALRLALQSGVSYVGLVASRKRGDAVRESLGVDASRLRSPAGIDIGARTPEHIALAILAEIVATRAEHAPPAADAGVVSAPTAPAAASGQHHCCHDDGGKH